MAIKSEDLPGHVRRQIARPAEAPTPEARGIPGEVGRMNKTEAAYAQHLGNRIDLVWWAFEPVKFRLADRTWYTPDFLVMYGDGTIEVHEVKGFWRDDARVKIKVAAEMYPFRFVAASREGNGWAYERIGRR